MTITQGETGESAQNASLRPLVAAIDDEVARLGTCTAAELGTALGALRASWGQAVAVLALGPAPEMRECPVCKHRGMRGATLCGFCWTKLSPLARGQGEQAIRRLIRRRMSPAYRLLGRRCTGGIGGVLGLAPPCRSSA